MPTAAGQPGRRPPRPTMATRPRAAAPGAGPFVMALAALAVTMASPPAALAQPGPATPEEQAAWFRDHAVPIRTIDPGDEDFGDLEPIATLIGDARIVQLGEQSHGDGATFHAKVRLVKFLHQRMGFDVLAWESGFYCCRRAEAALAGRGPLRDAAGAGVFGIWAHSEQVVPIFEYARATHATDRPLIMAGFDSQFSAGESASAWVADQRRIFAAMGGGAIAASELELICAEAARASDPAAPNLTDEQIAAVHHAADRLATRIHEHAAGAGMTDLEARVRRRDLANAAAFVEQAALQRRAMGDPTRMEPAGLVRDRAMAENLVFLAREVYPDRKIITWGASAHLMRSAGVRWRAEGGWESDTGRWMGDIAHAALGAELYTVGFIAYQGTAGSAFGPRWPVPPAEEGSLDDLCHRSGLPRLWLDLRGPSRQEGHWLRQPLIARPRGYAPMEADWTTACDAMVFIERMYPSTRATVWPDEAP